MSSLFDDLKEGLEEAIAYESGNDSKCICCLYGNIKKDDGSFIRDILYVLKKNTWIFDYYKKSDDEGYVVVKNPIKDKRY